MSEAENLLQDARKSFRLAADSFRTKDIERYAGMGRSYMQLAHDAAKIIESPTLPSLWNWALAGFALEQKPQLKIEKSKRPIWAATTICRTQTTAGRKRRNMPPRPQLRTTEPKNQPMNLQHANTPID
jgi:hypothetical protein